MVARSGAVGEVMSDVGAVLVGACAGAPESLRHHVGL